MKYFTMARHLADQDLDGDSSESLAAYNAYEAYLSAVRPQLPTGFRALLDTVCIHDANLLDIRVDGVGSRLAVTLQAGDLEMREGRRVRLWYERLLAFRMLGDPAAGFEDVGFGDLLYDEVEVLPSGFEHRILFREGAELVVGFGDFRLEVLSPDASANPLGAAT